MKQAEEFAEFAATASPRLLRAAYLLCGNPHTAEDLAQTTLMKVFAAWRRISHQDAVHAYATRTLINTYLADKRKKSSGEVITCQLPEHGIVGPSPEMRMVVLGALATLPSRARVVVVMRYWADMSVEDVAQLLGCSTGTVKSTSSRALDKLRDVLGGQERDLPEIGGGRHG